MLRESWGEMKPSTWSGARRCTRDGPTDNMRQLMGHGGPVGMGQAPGKEEAAPHWSLFGLRNNSGENKVFFLVASTEHLQAHKRLQEAGAEFPALILNLVPTSSRPRRAGFQPSNALLMGTDSHMGRRTGCSPRRS